MPFIALVILLPVRPCWLMIDLLKDRSGLRFCWIPFLEGGSVSFGSGWLSGVEDDGGPSSVRGDGAKRPRWSAGHVEGRSHRKLNLFGNLQERWREAVVWGRWVGRGGAGDWGSFVEERADEGWIGNGD